jgi:hypothetical protein
LPLVLVNHSWALWLYRNCSIYIQRFAKNQQKRTWKCSLYLAGSRCPAAVLAVGNTSSDYPAAKNSAYLLICTASWPIPRLLWNPESSFSLSQRPAIGP